MRAFRRAFKSSIPVLFGYVPLGVAFGLLFNTLGCPWFYAGLSGLVVFAGSAQFLCVNLLAAHASLAAIFFATLSLNLRHMFFGFSMFHRFPENRWLKPYLIFGLTDETYSVLTATKLENRREDERFCLWVTFLNHSYWVLGCALGGLLGSRFRFDTRGFDFVLTALFVVLALEQAFAVKRAFPFVIAGAAGAAALKICPKQMLPFSLAIVFAILLGKSLQTEDKDG